MSLPSLFTNKPLIEQYLQRFPTDIATLHLSSLVMWQDHFDFDITEIKGCLCVFAKQPKAQFLYWPPVGDVTQPVIQEVMARLNACNPKTARIENIAAKDKEVYLQAGLRLYEKANEYVYRKDDIIHYQGNRYKSQRHDVNLVEKEYALSVGACESTQTATCLGIFDQWAKHKKIIHHNDPIALDMLVTNRRAHELALLYQEQLGLLGIIVAINGKPCAYSLGYPLNQNTFVVLLEVCLPDIKGLSAYVFNRMCQQPWWKSFDYVNAMDDFGLPAVAHTKKLYHPIMVNPIFNAS